MSDNKLKIRINLQQPNPSELYDQNEQEALETQSNPEHWNTLEKPPFDWRKISIAVIVLIAIIGTSGYLFLSNSETKSLHGKSDAHNTLSESDYPTDYSSRFNTFDDIQSSASPSGILTETIAIEQQLEGESTDDIVSTAINKQNSTNDLINAPVPQSKPPLAAKTIKPVPPLPNIKPSGLATDNPLKTSQESKENSSSIIDEPIHVDAATSITDHPSVIRAQLTHEIRHREPIDAINRISLEDGKNKSIYFFVELHDLESQNIIAEWHFEERLVTQTKLHIGGNQWRTNASKLLRKRSIGAWKVILLDQTGNMLAERHFVVE